MYDRDTHRPGAGPSCSAADLDLIVRCLRREHEACCTLVLQYSGMLKAIGLRTAREDSLYPVDDFLQDVFTKVFERLGAFRGECSLRTWIYGIACNVDRDRWRRRRAYARFARAYSDSGHGPAADEEDLGRGRPQAPKALHPSPEDQFLMEEQFRRLFRAMAELPGHQQEVVALRAAGWSYEEIAGLLGFPLNTVKTFLLRARQRLRAHSPGGEE